MIILTQLFVTYINALRRNTCEMRIERAVGVELYLAMLLRNSLNCSVDFLSWNVSDISNQLLKMVKTSRTYQCRLFT